MYQALYRKYRPRRFSDVVGQEHITDTLSRQITTDRYSHAYLFIGTRGTGKTTCARILSRAVNCLNPAGGNPCNECPSCKGIEDGAIMDVLELDAASNNGVDDVRALREETIYSPASVKKRVYIIDEVHMLSAPAFNALLKVLEEPPPHIVFILATTEQHKVPATIQSRCQKFSFRRLTPGEITGHLMNIAGTEGLTLTPDAAQKLAQLSDGAMRDAISLLDQCISDQTIDAGHVDKTLGLASKNELLQIVQAITGRDITAALDVLGRLYDDGKDMTALLGELSRAFRDILVMKMTKNAANTVTLINSGISADGLQPLVNELSKERLLYCLDVARQVQLSLPKTGATRIIPELCLIRMCDERLSDDPAAILARVEMLERTGPQSTVPQSAAPQYEALQSAIPPVDTPQNTGPQSTAPQFETPQNAVPQPETAPMTEYAPEDDPVSVRERHPIHLPETSGTPQASAPAVPAGIPGKDSGSSPAGSAEDSLLSQILQAAGNPALSALLGGNSKTHISFSEGVLAIETTDAVSADMIESTFAGILGEAAKKIYGREVILKIQMINETGDEGRQSKLDELVQMHPGLVKIE